LRNKNWKKNGEIMGDSSQSQNSGGWGGGQAEKATSRAAHRKGNNGGRAGVKYKRKGGFIARLSWARQTGGGR